MGGLCSRPRSSWLPDRAPLLARLVACLACRMEGPSASAHRWRHASAASSCSTVVPILYYPRWSVQKLSSTDRHWLARLLSDLAANLIVGASLVKVPPQWLLHPSRSAGWCSLPWRTWPCREGGDGERGVSAEPESVAVPRGSARRNSTRLPAIFLATSLMMAYPSKGTMTVGAGTPCSSVNVLYSTPSDNAKTTRTSCLAPSKLLTKPYYRRTVSRSTAGRS